MELLTPVCGIRSFHPEDAWNITTYANSREIWLQLRDVFPHPYTVGDAKAFISIATSQQPETAFAIDVEGKASGSIGLTLQADINRCAAEIGYWLGKPYWGRGIATTAIAAVTNWAMDAFSLQRIFAVPFSDNLASCRVLEKAGFQREGLMQKSAIKDGQVRDQVMYAMTVKP